jgi:hypothetical protein
MWHEPCGDRQIEISIVVNHSNNFIRGEIYALFRRCLLNDEDFRIEQELWKEIEDPFSFSYE